MSKMIYLRLGVVTILVFGIGYPLLMTAAAKLCFPKQANGSMLTDKDGRIVGSQLIGQQFTDPKYFKGRLSSINYDASNSGSNNYGPSNPKMIKKAEQAAEYWLKSNKGRALSDVPIDLITNSGSSLDPHISVRAAKFQIPMVARANHLAIGKLDRLVQSCIEPKSFGFLGEPKVNVLKLNLALKELME